MAKVTDLDVPSPVPMDTNEDDKTVGPLANYGKFYPKLTEPEEDLLASAYKMPIFVLSLYNVHYHSLYKNDKYFEDYKSRFESLWNRILQLPDFYEKNPLDLPASELKDCIVGLATKQGQKYGRQLLLSFRKITGTVKTEKKLRVTLNEDKVVDTDVEEPSNGITQTALDSSELMTNAEPAKLEARQPLNLFLGDIKLVDGVQYLVTFPKETNFLESDLFIKLSLMDFADPSEREYVRIKISEALITGYTGMSRKFAIKLNEGDEALSESFSFELHAKWNIDSEDYRGEVKNPVEILKKLPCTLSVLGEYCWHFCVGYYKWCLLDSDDPFVRYTAIQIFHKLCLVLSSTLLHDQMTNIYRLMYPPDGYPKLDTLPHLTKSEYLLEPLSQLDNVIFVFGHLFADEQIELVRALLPHSTLLVSTRFRFTKRLVMLLRKSVSNYQTQSIEVIIPFATDLFNYLACITNPENELKDPRSGVITLAKVNSLSRHLCCLVVECIKWARPQHWSKLRISNYKMAGLCAVMNETIRSLFNPNGITFLKQIYIQLYQVKALKRAQLVYFLTPNRIQQYQEWIKHN